MNPTGTPPIHKAVSAMPGSRMKGIFAAFALAAAALAAAEVVPLARVAADPKSPLMNWPLPPKALAPNGAEPAVADDPEPPEPPDARSERRNLAVLGRHVGRRRQRVGGQTAKAVGRGQREVARRELPDRPLRGSDPDRRRRSAARRSRPPPSAGSPLVGTAA